jgi:hypothetical protein
MVVLGFQREALNRQDAKIAKEGGERKRGIA